MNSLQISIIYALFASLSFSLGSMVFTTFSKRFSPYFTNFFKNFVALCAFSIICLFTPFQSDNFLSLSTFFFSGLIALGLGDILLLKSFSTLGPGRTLLLFGFHPLITGLMAYVLFEQSFGLKHLIGIFCFFICLYLLSLESLKKVGHYNLKIMLFALGGVFLDALGIILTRKGFENNPELSPLWANFFRCFGAVTLFWLFVKKRPLNLKNNFLSIPNKVKLLFIFGSLIGTFLSLLFYLKAIKYGHLATLSGVSLTTPLFATVFERIFFKKPLTLYFLFSFIFFALGLFFITIYV